MCNCGKKRTELKQQPIVHNKINVVTTQSMLHKTAPVLFKYIGNTALTVTGNITRKNYRFSFNGDVQSIDFSDAASMAAIPVLKRIT